MSDWLPGVHIAPNIQQRPDLYELENEAADPEQRLEAAMRAVAPMDDALVLDLGAGTGFHAARYAATARHVFAVEPHGPSRALAMQRALRLGLENVSVMTGSAAQILLPDHSVDIAHARFAYFWGPGCEPGLAELARVVRPGGAAFIIDNDLRHGTFASWLMRSRFAPTHDADALEAFWHDQGFSTHRVMSAWTFQTRDALERVVANEFPPELVPELLAEHEGLSISYGYNLMHRVY